MDPYLPILQHPVTTSSPVGYIHSTSKTVTTPSTTQSSPQNNEEGVSPADDELDSGDGPPRKKQKRNKPTLSCLECVERKTKCDRGRPNCLACIKRFSECRYAHVANVLQEANHSVSNARRMTKPPKPPTSRTTSQVSLSHNGSTTPGSTGKVEDRPKSRGLPSMTMGLLSDVTSFNSTASNVFGIGSEHPFANYWTCQGGLPEVISVLPEKIQADILLERYFEVVDAVYPMVHRQTFFADYEHFWSLPQSEKNSADGTMVALIFAMLAMGTQFVNSTEKPSNATKQTAEFYVSAAHQSLRMSSYLNKTSIRSLQAMVLITYFLINDNHASDGWAFAGILIRQAYAMNLHRDPNIAVPNATIFEKQQRRKLWQAVLLQDTFLTVLLSLPPSATHTDVSVSDLVEDTSSIAPSSPTDTAYIRGCWTLANLVQEVICSPRSLDLPICSNVRQKAALLGSFKTVYRSFPDIFRSWDPHSLSVLSITNKRVVRQTLFLTSNYWHNVMLLHASESSEVKCNVRGTLEAAHEAIQAFFLLRTIFGGEARVWWVFNHRAFLEAMCMGNLLRDYDADGRVFETVREEENRDEGEKGIGEGNSFIGQRGSPDSGDPKMKDPLFVRAKEDIVRMIDITKEMSEGTDDSSEVAKTRVAVLSAYV